jgi:hypothetical protein
MAGLVVQKPCKPADCIAAGGMAPAIIIERI